MCSRIPAHNQIERVRNDVMVVFFCGVFKVTCLGACINPKFLAPFEGCCHRFETT